MQRYFFLGLVVTLIIFSIPMTAHANLLANSGFESWVIYEGNEVPADWWHMFSDPDLIGVKESVIKNSGSYSGKAQITGGTGWGGWGQWVTVSAGQTLYSHQPLNIPNALTNAEAVLEIKFRNASEAVLAMHVAKRSTATGEWEALDVNQVAPPNTVKASYSVLLRDIAGSPSPHTGIVYFDDAYADTVPIPEPTSLLLLGSGLVGMMFIARKRR